MTKNEVDIIKNSTLDSTEAYVDARLERLDFVRTQIGVVISNEKRSDKKYYHIVRCNATRQNPNGVRYYNVLSVGNTPFPPNSVVFLIAPNAQFSNQFILGKLDDTPVNITAGSIALGGEGDSAPIYLTGTQQSDGSYGHISSFKIYSNRLEFTGANSSVSFISPTAFRISEFKDSGGNKISMMMDGDNAWVAVNTGGYDGGGLVVSNVEGWVQGGGFNNPLGGDYVRINPTTIENNTSFGKYYITPQAFKFLDANQNELAYLELDVDDSGITFSWRGHSVKLNW